MRLAALPIWLSVGILVFGFGAMNLFWLADRRAAGVPGLYDFRSATIGDALLLPLFVFISSTSIIKFSDIASPRLAVGPTVGALGAALGLASQIQWLVSDDTIPNWTIPQPHQFTAAGWYHAVFLVLASGLIASLLALSILQFRSLSYLSSPDAQAQDWLPYLVGIVVTLGAFGGLLLLDNVEIANWSSSTMWGGFLLLGIVIASVIWGAMGPLGPVPCGMVWAGSMLAILLICSLTWDGLLPGV